MISMTNEPSALPNEVLEVPLLVGASLEFPYVTQPTRA